MAEQQNLSVLNWRSHWFWFAITAWLVVSSLAVVLFWPQLYACEKCKTDNLARKRVTFITVNDTYRIDGLSQDRLGGLHRLRTLRSWVERDAPDAILLHAGDFLAPSMIGNVFKGERMIGAMNQLDGDDRAFDRRMFVVFGNHEFDHSKCGKDAPLVQRVEESQFTWLNANLDFSKCQSMQRLDAAERPDGKVQDISVLEVNGIKIGLFGIGLTPEAADGDPPSADYPAFEDEEIAARRSINKLKVKGADFIVGLTHLPYARDEALIDALAPNGLDLLVGGHDHDSMVMRNERGFKADSDARTAWLIDVDFSDMKRPNIKAKLVTLNEAIPIDPKMDEIAKNALVDAETNICSKRNPGGPQCLREPVGWTQTPIDLDETVNRGQETGFGDWLAKIVREKTKADVAIVTAGSLGLNDNLEPGHTLTLRDLVDIFRYDGIIATRAFAASEVCKGLRGGFNSPGAGSWPHVDGVEVEIERPNPNGKLPTIRFTTKPLLDCDSDAKVTVASLTYVLCGHDGYHFQLDNQNKATGETCAPLGYDRLTNPTEDVAQQVWLSGIAQDAMHAEAGPGIRPVKDGHVLIRTTTATPPK
jgi:2',3'-cyclic-nucleotide 2'-phosphodiesterase (5'-nucleotidase family)